MSPPSAGFSILMISAPRSANCIEPYGPAPYCSTAMTRSPERTGSMSAYLLKPHDIWHVRFAAESVPLARYSLDHPVRALVGPRLSIADVDRPHTIRQQFADKSQSKCLYLLRCFAA